MRRVGLLYLPIALQLLLASGGCAPPEEPKTPDPAGSEPAAAAEPASAAEEEPEAPAEPASAEDVRAVLQAVLDDESLQQYLGLSEPGRLPFKISGEGLPAELELIKGPDPVQIVDAPKDKTEPVMVITEMEINSKSASIRFRYDVAKLRASANLEKRDWGWELVNSSQSQR